MKRWRSAVILCVLLFVVACSSQARDMQDVSNPPERIFLTGFSLLPLHEKGWMVLVRDQFRLALKRKIAKEPNESFIIAADLVPLENYKSEEEFRHRVMARQATYVYLNSPLYKVIQNETRASAEKGTECARTHVVSENMAAARLDKTSPLILEILSFTCVHPQYKGVAVEVNYSQQYYAGHRDPAFLEKAERVFSSIEFNKLNFKTKPQTKPAKPGSDHGFR